MGRRRGWRWGPGEHLLLLLLVLLVLQEGGGVGEEAGRQLGPLALPQTQVQGAHVGTLLLLVLLVDLGHHHLGVRGASPHLQVLSCLLQQRSTGHAVPLPGQAELGHQGLGEEAHRGAEVLFQEQGVHWVSTRGKRGERKRRR